MAPTVINHGGAVFPLSGVAISQPSGGPTTLTGTGVQYMRAGDAVFDATTPGAIPVSTSVTSVTGTGSGTVVTLNNSVTTTIGASDVLVQPKAGNVYESWTTAWANPTTPGTMLIALVWSSDDVTAGSPTISGAGPRERLKARLEHKQRCFMLPVVRGVHLPGRLSLRPPRARTYGDSC